MGSMKRAVLLSVIVTAVGLNVSRSAPSPQNPGKTQTTGNSGQVERGRYLAEEVARCSECHTPRDAQGNLEKDRWLQGASTWISPVHATPNWALWAPPLAGLPSYTDEQAERVLEQGVGANGDAIHAPMHTYHLTKDDARAIIAYLRSLPQAEQ